MIDDIRTSMGCMPLILHAMLNPHLSIFPAPGEITWDLNCDDGSYVGGGAPYEGSIEVQP